MSPQHHKRCTSTSPAACFVSVLLLIHRKVTNIPVATNLRCRLNQAFQASKCRFLFLPIRATVNTSHTASILGHFPLLETLLVEVLATRSFAPDDVFISLHGEDADGALAIDGLAVTIKYHLLGMAVTGKELGGASDWCVFENRCQLVGQECELVAEMSGSLQDHDQCIYLYGISSILVDRGTADEVSERTSYSICACICCLEFSA
jgi:hypothetical protein